MDGALIAIAIKPLGLLVFLGGVAFIAWSMKRAIPDSAAKTLMYDRTFRNRHPRIFTALIVLSYILIFAFIGFMVERGS